MSHFGSFWVILSHFESFSGQLRSFSIIFKHFRDILAEPPFAQRNQLIRRHEKENEHQHKSQLSDLDDLETKHRSEKKRFPAVQRSEAKTRLSMFKQKLKIDRVSDAVYRSKLKKFQVNEEQRMQNERLEQQLKHDRQRTEMLDSHKAEAEEMQSVQNEKRKMLIEREQERLFALDDAFKRDFEAWRNQLPGKFRHF